MGAWDRYAARATIYGATGRERALNRTQDFISRKIVDSLSYHNVTINGVPQSVVILTDNSDISKKKIRSLPGESLAHGGLVDYADNKWLITELSADDEVYASGIMEQCNYILKWINPQGKIIEKWCRIVDGTKYLIGEKSNQLMSIGDARMALTIGKDEDTIGLKRGMRFLIADLDQTEVLAYQITKPNTLFNIYENEGVFRFIMNEVNLTDNDNTELRIADYYSWMPHIPRDNDHVNPDIPIEDIVEAAKQKASEEPDDDKGVWL